MFFKSGERLFYVYGFAKSSLDSPLWTVLFGQSAMGNIDDKQLKRLKKTAKVTLAYIEKQLDELVKNKWFIEIEEE